LDDPTQAYLDLIDSGELKAHVTCSQFWDPKRGIEQLEELQEQRERLREAGLDAGSIKLMMDGITETFTAAVTEPYLGDTGCPCGDRGMEFLSPEQAEEALVALDAAGFRAHFHAIGDRAVHSSLDAVAAARRANGMTDNRHQIAHLQLVLPGDRQRFRELGVTANAEGMWTVRSTGAVRDLLPHLDEERQGWHYPFRDLVDAGAELAGGSDWPVNPPEPIGGIHGMVNRTAWSPDGDAPEPLVPEQALTLEEALHAYTEGSARVSYRQDVGSVLVGSQADLVVLDRNPFLAPAEEIGAAEVAQTWLAGELVYEQR
jgi:predicted amidohydrolase YtcJ